MRAVDADRPTQPDFPFTRQTSGLVYVPVQGEERLPFIYEPPHRNAANMYV
jgi:hypothetical protein